MRRWLVNGLTLLGLLGAAATAQEPAFVDRRLLATPIDRQVLMRNYQTAVQVAVQDQQQAVERSGKGPMEAPIPLADLLEVRGLADFGMTSLQDIANLSLEVYPDANKDSGIFYYRPRQYFLHWTPDDQYYLSIDYKPEQASDKNVVLDARLTPGPVGDDVQVLKRLLKAHLRRQPPHMQPPNIEQIAVLPLPARYEAQFDWSGYGVAEEDITVTGVDPDTRQFGLQIQTDVATKELLMGKLGDPAGLEGDMRIVPQEVTPSQPALSSFTVRARLKLADTDAYGRASFRRGGGEFSTLRNDHSFPVRLRYLTYLIEEAGRLVLRGYDLGDRSLLPGDTAKLGNESVTSQIGEPTVVRSWYSLTLDNDETYRKQVVRELTGGVGLIPVTDVDIQIVRVAELFQQYDIFKIVVVVRSEFFDPNPDAVGAIEKGYEFSAETGQVPVAPLYRPEGATGPLYEYRIGLVTNDGVPHQDAAWRTPAAGFAGSVFIGSSQIEEVLEQ